jgi:hypothetical protein
MLGRGLRTAELILYIMSRIYFLSSPSGSINWSRAKKPPYNRLIREEYHHARAGPIIHVLSYNDETKPQKSFFEIEFAFKILLGLH